ncbi:MAG: HAD hydrolase family protein [Patescibacteria group bacterium]|nr:HAD hydrolase family protein [Patescibacteria group bacterium]
MKKIIRKKLCGFKALVLDGDGVFFTGQETRGVTKSGEAIVMKTRSLIDGQGISFLRAIGIKVTFASGEGEPLNSIVEKLNTLPSVKKGLWEPIERFTDLLDKGKVGALETWLHAQHVSWDECAYMGDDRTDLEAMQHAGLKVAPANAQKIIKDLADIVTYARGGDGAIREFAELVLEARGVSGNSLPAA